MKIKKLYEDQNADPNAEKAIEQMPAEEQSDIKKLKASLHLGDDVVENPTLVTEALDDCLKQALRAYRHGKVAGPEANLLLVGRAGTGKTEQVKRWCEARGLNLVQKSAQVTDEMDLGGGTAREVDDEGRSTNRMTRLATTEFDDLDQPGTVLFLDELNRASIRSMGAFLSLVLNHWIPDRTQPNGRKHFKNFLFTVAAINPADYYDGTTALDGAMLSRFAQVDTSTINTMEFKKYLVNELGKNIKTVQADIEAEDDPDERNELVDELTDLQGMQQLANTILSSPIFAWDDLEEEAECTERGVSSLNPRQFEAVIRASDGKKDKFLKVWPRFCNPDKLDMVEQILVKYKDVDDKANDALRYKDGFADDEKPAQAQASPEPEEDDDDLGIFKKSTLDEINSREDNPFNF